MKRLFFVIFSILLHPFSYTEVLIPVRPTRVQHKNHVKYSVLFQFLPFCCRCV
jgi:hypothetical protein